MSEAKLLFHPVSLDLEFRNAEENLKRIEAAIVADSTRTEESVFIFPELTLTGFVTLNPDKVAVTAEHETIQKLRAIAKRHRVAIVAGFIEAGSKSGASAKPSNTTLFIGRDGDVIARYVKIHLFTKGNPSEFDTFEKGQSPCIVNYLGHRLGLAVCFDVRFPALIQHYAEKQVDAIVIIACWISGPNKKMQFRALSQAHAITSRAYVVAVNRTGSDPNFKYEGENFAFEPTGIEISDRPVALNQDLIEATRSYVTISYDHAFRENSR